jgi:hypothetical protein
VNISGKMYPKVEIECMKVPDFGREVRLNGATIQVLVREGDESLWVPASWLKDERKAWQDIVENVAWQIGAAAVKAGMSKAELKRKLILAGAISK